MSPQVHVVTQEFPAPEPVAASVRVGAGELVVTAEDRPYVVITVDPADSGEASRQAAEQTEINFDGARLRVDVPPAGSGRIFRRGGQVRVNLRVPLDSRLQAQLGSADIRAEGRLGETAITTGSGDVSVTETSGLCQVETGSGDVRVRQAGELRATTASGEVSVALVRLGATVKTASGDVRITEGRGPIRANSASGDVQIEAALGERVEVHTASGDAEVGIPAGTSVWLDLSTVSGDTNSDLTMTGTPDEGRALLTVQVRTVSGDIKLRRVGPPVAA